MVQGITDSSPSNLSPGATADRISNILRSRIRIVLVGSAVIAGIVLPQRAGALGRNRVITRSDARRSSEGSSGPDHADAVGADRIDTLQVKMAFRGVPQCEGSHCALRAIITAWTPSGLKTSTLEVPHRDGSLRGADRELRAPRRSLNRGHSLASASLRMDGFQIIGPVSRLSVSFQRRSGHNIREDKESQIREDKESKTLLKWTQDLPCGRQQNPLGVRADSAHSAVRACSVYVACNIEKQRCRSIERSTTKTVSALSSR